MKRQKLQISALLILTAFLSTSAFSVYGLTSTKTGGKVDAIASATQAAPKPTPPAPTPSPKPVVKPIVKPVVKPAVKPSPAPIAAVPSPTTSEFTETAFGLNVLGKTLVLTGTPIILATDGQTMLPLRKTAEAMGYTVKWDDVKKAAVLENSVMSITIYRDNTNFLRGSTFYTLNRKPVIFKNSLYVSTDFLTSDPTYWIDLTSDSIVIDMARNDVKPAITLPKQDDSDDKDDDD